MLALFPPLFSTTGWPLETSTSHADQNYVYKDTETSESRLHVPPSQPQLVDQNLDTKLTSINSGDPSMVKKLNHNASERDRRKKINILYSTLRSQLPGEDHTKKLSIPTTVSRVLKYIPELQHQVEGLFQKKEELLSKLSSKGDLSHQEVESKNAARRTGPAVSASRLNDRELIIQISKYNIYKCSLSEILLYLEENGLLLLNASSFESFGGRVFYNLHFQVERTNRLECEFLSKMVMSLIEKRNNYFHEIMVKHIVAAD
jgi:hypothetical protein